jgi:hypothetical protein
MSTTIEAISYSWSGLCQTHIHATRINPQELITKGYISIFVYFATKAVHLEVVRNLITEAFLAALRCFIAHQGRPRTIYSDHGTNFQGASNQLHEVYNMLQSSSEMMKVQDFLTTEGYDWKFIPPH